MKLPNKNLQTPSIRAFHSDEWELYRSLRLAALAESPNAFGSTLDAEQRRERGVVCAARVGNGVWLGSSLDCPDRRSGDRFGLGKTRGHRARVGPRVPDVGRSRVQAPRGRAVAFGRLDRVGKGCGCTTSMFERDMWRLVRHAALS